MILLFDVTENNNSVIYNDITLMKLLNFHYCKDKVDKIMKKGLHGEPFCIYDVKGNCWTRHKNPLRFAMGYR